MNNSKPYRACQALTLVVVLPLGCESVTTTVSLHQPVVQGRQQRLELSSAQTWWSADDGAERLLVELPLPGASTGRPMYLLYLRVSPSLANSESESQVRGFLIQTHGEYAGRVDVKEGSVYPVRLGKDEHQADIDLTMEDGTRVGGHLVAQRDDFRMSRFETEQRPGDVQSLKTRQEAGSK